MSPVTTSRVRPFTPSAESAATLSARTVGRDGILEHTVQRLVDAAHTRNRAHTLYVGPRGSGKTHLVNVAIHRAVRDEAVRQRLVFVRFDEDAVGINRFADILREVLAQLAPESVRQLLPVHGKEAIAQTLGDRVLVLVLENLDRIFHDLGKAGQQDFRSWVENSGQILVFATTPLLFPGISDRALPWWGNFGLSHLEELDLEDGRQLLINLASESGDQELADFIATETGEARLRAINALAGGSPRIWMILSQCLTVEVLDELVPAVEALLEGLVPYYQQLLWGLSPVEQRLIRELANGAYQAATVKELAEACGVQQRVAATTLGRLTDIRWVKREKAPELDKRSTFYRLREPMLRHHFQYRSAAGQPLPLIVEILKGWYDPARREAELAVAEPASYVERLMAAALREDSSSLTEILRERDVDRLQAEARRWIYGGWPETRPSSAGILIDLAVTGARDGRLAVGRVLPHRDLPDLDAVAAARILNRTDSTSESSIPDQVGDLIRDAAQCTVGATRILLTLVSACWDGHNDPWLARSRLTALASSTEVENDVLRVEIQGEAAWWTERVGTPEEVCTEYMRLFDIQVSTVGRYTVEAIATASVLSVHLGESGNFQKVYELLSSLLDAPEIARVESSIFLTLKYMRATALGALGRYDEARREMYDTMQQMVKTSHPQRLGAFIAQAKFTRKLGHSFAAAQMMAAAVMNMYRQGEVAHLPPVLDEFFQCLVAVPADEASALSDRSGGNEEAEIASLFVWATRGSTEALLRLPSELVPIVEMLRDGLRQPATQ